MILRRAFPTGLIALGLGCAQVLDLDITFGDPACDAGACGGAGGTSANVGGAAGAAGAPTGGSGGSAPAVCYPDEVLTQEPEFCPGYGPDVCSFDGFMENAVAVGSSYIVDGDVLVADAAAARQYFDAAITAQAEPAIVTPLTRERRREIWYCVEDGSLGARYGAVVDSAHSAAVAWEQLAAVRFAYIAASDARCFLRITYDASSPASVVSLPVTLAAADEPRVVVLGPDAFHGLAKPDLASRLRHAFGHVLGFGHAHTPPTACEAELCDRVTHLQASIMRRSWCGHSGVARLYPTQVDGDAVSRAYGGPELMARTTELYARDVRDGRLHVSFSAGEWQEIGGATLAVVAASAGVFRLDQSGRVQRLLEPGTWGDEQSGVGRLFACLDTVCATDAQNGNLSVRTGAKWEVIGGPARRYDATSHEIVRIDLRGEVQRHIIDWDAIRSGEAGQLYTGSNAVYVTNPFDRDGRAERLERWMSTNDSWAYAAPPGSYVITSSGVAFIDPADETLELSDNSTQSTWQPIGAAGLRVVYSGTLLRMDLDGTIWEKPASSWVGRGRP